MILLIIDTSQNYQTKLIVTHNLLQIILFSHEWSSKDCLDGYFNKFILMQLR